MELVESFLKRIILWLVVKYRLFVSPAILPRCRFYPTCSSYAVVTIQQNSLLKALILILFRLIRCHPFGGYQVDLPKNDFKKGI